MRNIFIYICIFGHVFRKTSIPTFLCIFIFNDVEFYQRLFSIYAHKCVFFLPRGSSTMNISTSLPTFHFFPWPFCFFVIFIFWFSCCTSVTPIFVWIFSLGHLVTYSYVSETPCTSCCFCLPCIFAEKDLPLLQSLAVRGRGRNVRESALGFGEFSLFSYFEDLTQPAVQWYWEYGSVLNLLSLSLGLNSCCLWRQYREINSCADHCLQLAGSPCP